MARILLAGEIVAERQYLVDITPTVNQVAWANSFNSLTSSKIINAGRIMAKSNKVSMFGVVGQDTDGEKAIKNLQEYGINPSLVYSTPKAPTGQVIVVTNKQGHSAFILYFPTGKYFDQLKLKDLSGFDYIYMATSMHLPQLYKLVERAHKQKVKIFIDFPNQQKEFDKTQLRHIDFIAPNRQEAELLLGTKILTITNAIKSAKLLKSYTDGIVVITLDKDGCVAFTKNWKQPKHFPVRKVKVVDDTGSGDIFRGVFLNEFIKTSNLERSIEKAVNLATKSTKYQGVDDSINKIKLLV